MVESTPPDPPSRDSELDTLRRDKEQYRLDVRRLREALEQTELELSKARRRGEEAMLAKSQFLANMSHELRTPMNSIIGFAEILSDKIGADIDPRYQKFLSNILHSGRHLLGLINDILDLSKIEAGHQEPVFEKVSVADVGRGVRGVLLGMATPRNIEIRLDMPPDLPPILADGPKLKQILYNLVANGIKFSDDYGEVILGARRLAAETSPIDEETLEVYVTDHGIGIAAQHHASIFTEFQQIDSSANREHPGAGLGLTLAKRFTEMHGGVITVESMPGAGSTFRVLLPLDASQVILAPTRSDLLPDEDSAAASGGRPPVLVVEDDEPFYRALASDLRAAGYRVERARHGEEALSMAATLMPVAITLDLALPGMDGWEVLKALKLDRRLATIPVIIISLVENHELGFALGADDYFLKPLERRKFLQRLHDLLADAETVPTVLVIDDDVQVHEVLAEDLDAAGYRRLAAFDGEHGLRLARQEAPSIIVLDLMMPGISGFEVAVQLRSDPETAAIPIVVLTAKELTRQERRQLAGLDGLMTKAPMDRRAILSTLRGIEGRPGG